MVFVETRILRKQVKTILTDDGYAEFQAVLRANPKAGDVIRGTGGARKIRWATPGSGKSGGVRIIYATIKGERIYLLIIYEKAAQEGLTADQKKTLKSIIDALN